MGNQIRVLEQIAVLLSTHQPEHGLRVADRIALLGREKLLAVGSPVAMATPRALAELYGVSETAIASHFSAHLTGGL